MSHLKYPLLVVTIALLTNNYFILILDLETKAAVFFIFGVVFSNNNTMVMQICLLNVLIILHLLLLCWIVVLLPAGDALGDSEGWKQLINPCWVYMAWCPVFILAEMESLEANHTQEVLSLFFCEVLLCSVVVFLFFRKLFFQACILMY